MPDPSIPPSLPEQEFRLRLAGLVCLTVIVVAAIVGLTVAAVFTDRYLLPAELLTLAGAILVAVMGGLIVGTSARRRHRWRVEREDVNGGR